MESACPNNTDLNTGRMVCIVTTGQIYNARTAGARRVLNISRSLAFGNVKVFIFSFADFQVLSPEIHEIHKNISGYCRANLGSGPRPQSFLDFLRISHQNIKRNRLETVIYLYPTTFIFKDFIYLLYFKYLKGYRFFCEINELRSSIAFSSKAPKGLILRVVYLLKSGRDYIIYKANELQVRLYDGITVISVGLEKYFMTRARRLIRIPILCNSDDIPTESTTKLYDGGAFKICFSGYVKIDKEGFGILIESLSKVNKTIPVELYLYGILEVEDSIRLKELTVKHGLNDRVHYMGNVDPNELPDEFRKYHLLILPRTLNSRTKYGLSTKLSEYLVSATPVLVTDVSDNSLLIRDNYNGFIIPPGSSEIMAEKISEIIRMYNLITTKVVENAHKTVFEKLDYRLFSKQYSDFFFSEASKN